MPLGNGGKSAIVYSLDNSEDEEETDEPELVYIGNSNFDGAAVKITTIGGELDTPNVERKCTSVQIS